MTPPRPLSPREEEQRIAELREEAEDLEDDRERVEREDEQGSTWREDPSYAYDPEAGW